MNSEIPRRIVQTGKNADLPLFSKAAATTVKLLNPDFEYMFFDNKGVEEFIAHQFPEYENVFHSFSFPIQRYDFFRYLAVYHLGGFYFDLDVFLASSLEGLLNFGCVFPFEELTIHGFLRREHRMDWEIGNYAFGAAAGHPFIRAVIENCVRAQKDPKWIQPMMRSIPRMFRDEYYVLNSTGPGLVSRTLAEYVGSAAQVKVLFPENVCDPATWHRFGTFGVHLQEATWRRRKNILWHLLNRLWESRTRGRLLRESLKLGKSRSLEPGKKTSDFSHT